MKKVLFALAAMIALAACGSEQAATTFESSEASNEVTFEVAKNYFFKNDQEIPTSSKITTAEEFGKLFGMATTMKQFVLAIVLPVTDFATEINPQKVEEKGDSLFYTFEVKKGEKQTYRIQPVSIIILDNKYENKEVVLSEDK